MMEMEDLQTDALVGVSDPASHDLLAEIIEELLRLRNAGQTPILDATRLAQDRSLALLGSKLDAIGEILQDIAIGAGGGQVTLPPEILVSLQEVARLRFPETVEIPDEAIEKLKAAIRDIRPPPVTLSGGGRNGTTADKHSVEVRDMPVTPTVGNVTTAVTDEVLVSPAAGKRLRLHRFTIRLDPAVASGQYNIITLKIGSTVIYSDKFDSGFPYSERINIEGGVDEDITLTTDAAHTVYYNLRTEEY